MALPEQVAFLPNTQAWAVSALSYGCPDAGGWGPFDPARFDFASCFEPVLYALPVAILAFGSAVELPRLSRRPDCGLKGRGQRSKQLHATKLALAATLIGVQTLYLGIRAAQSSDAVGDVTVWSNFALWVGFVLAVPLHHYSHLRSRRSCTVLLFYYLAFLIVDLIRLRTLIDLRSYARHLAPFVIFCARLGLLLAVFAFECLGPESASSGAVRLPEDGSALGTESEERVECPVVRANIFSRLTFAWMTPMMTEGYRKYLNEEDLWALPRADQADALAARMRKAWHAQLAKIGGKPSLIRAIVRAFGWPYLEAFLLKLFNDCLQFLQPQLLMRLLTFVDSYKSGGGEEAHHGYIIALGMFACGILQSAFLHQYFKRCFETGMRIRGGMIALVYSKSLVMSNEERAGRATGDVVNLMSTDVSRLQDVTSYGLIAFSGAFQIVLAFLSLYQLLGWPMLSGVAVMILSIPLNTFLARYATKLNKQQMKNKDQRTRLMNEILSNIRSIKLYAYEHAFTRRLLAIRNDRELKLLRKMGFVNSASAFTWNLMPFLVGFLSFAIFSITSDKALTPALVFPAISLFQLLQFPLAVLPMVINSWVEAYVSIGRLTDFLTGQELQKDAAVREDIVGAANYGDELVKVESADFAWSAAGQPTLSDISLSLKKGELIAVVGRVGSGKSSLLAAALGEMTRLQGSVKIRGKVAYAAQSAWLLSATVKENIVFGHRWDEGFYKQTIEACALKEDLAMLKDGDETQVGEKGISLSGGQKARVSMARAVYARADVYLLDDSLAAVDSHVARHLFDHVIGPKGILRSKARLLCTNAIPYCQEADELIMLRNGKIIERGSYESVLAAEGELNKLLAEFGKKTEERESGEQGADSDESSDTAVDSDKGKEKEAASKSTASSQSNLRRRISTATVRRASMVPADQQKRAALQAYKSSTKVRESRATGSVKRDIYKKYIQANGYLGVAIYCFTILAQQGASIATNFWLRTWSSSNESSHGNSGLGYYLGIYALLGFGSSFLILINGVFLYTFCVVRSARILHDSMYEAVLRSPMSFFEQTPIGTILNRFSRDVYVTDEVLARVFGSFFRTMGSVVGVFGVIAYSVPPFLIVCIPLMFLYKRIQSYYLATSRELKRLDATTKSPIFASFGETLSGLSTIRAFKQQERFVADNEARLDRNQEAYYPSVSCNRWLAVRLELIGSFIILCAAVLAVFSLITSRAMDAGLVGLLMSYALSTTQSLNWVVRSATEVETNIVSLERMIEYADLPSEAPQEIPERAPEPSWPETGSIAWKHYSCRYRDGLDLVLDDLTFEIKGGEKIGVCGRTGAGKSTITMGLYRVIEPASGTIEIDGVDITKIGLHALRSRLSIIPQDSQCFEGTLRQNVDPTEEYSDDQLWSALESSKLKEHVQSMGGLEAKVEEGGSNLSNGQRQLMCLARALLRRSKILVMDEATSAVDPESDRDIQAVIRQEFAKATLFVIAHRLNTIMDCDRILVLSAGKVVELDTPARLLQNPEGVFAGMCREAGIDPASASASAPASASTPAPAAEG